MFKAGDQVLLINPKITKENGYTANVGDVIELESPLSLSDGFRIKVVDENTGEYIDYRYGTLTQYFLQKNYVLYNKKNWVKYMLKFMDQQGY